MHLSRIAANIWRDVMTAVCNVAGNLLHYRLLIMGAALLAPLAANAETTVGISGVHICCDGCAAAIEEAVAKTAEDKDHPAEVKCAIDAEERSVELVGADVDAVQAAVNQIAAAGFHGKLDNKEVAWPKSKAPKGKTSRLELTGVHNCCGACAKAIKKALAEVDGVAGDTVKPKESSFVVEGDFEPRAVIKALRKAGFHATLAESKK
jgi:periplasmic mercuric ion binding protein